MESGYIDTDKKVFYLFRIIELGYDTYEINFLNIPAKFRISLNFGMKNRIRLIYWIYLKKLFQNAENIFIISFQIILV